MFQLEGANGLMLEVCVCQATFQFTCNCVWEGERGVWGVGVGIWGGRFLEDWNLGGGGVGSRWG